MQLRQIMAVQLDHGSASMNGKDDNWSRLCDWLVLHAHLNDWPEIALGMRDFWASP